MSEIRFKKESAFIRFYRSFRKHRMANLALYLLLLEILLVLLIPLFMDLDPYSIDRVFDSPPSSVHLLGTDSVGRDIFARLIYGGQISLLVGFASTLLSVAIGLPLGLIAGYYRGMAETIIMRVADVFLSFPSMVLTIVMVAIFGSSIPVLILLIGVLAWPQPCRLIYGRVLSVRKMEFVEAAKAEGRSTAEIIMKYILPNSVAPLWMSIAFMISSAMVTESSLSFLGAGVQPPMASWGNIVHNATNVVVLYMYPWEWLPAGILLIITVICINFVGEGVRDALDPKMKR